MKKIIASVAAGTLLLGMSYSLTAVAADAPAAKSDTSSAPADAGKEKKAHKGKKGHKAAKKEESKDSSAGASK